MDTWLSRLSNGAENRLGGEVFVAGERALVVQREASGKQTDRRQRTNSRTCVEPLAYLLAESANLAHSPLYCCIASKFRNFLTGGVPVDSSAEFTSSRPIVMVRSFFLRSGFPVLPNFVVFQSKIEVHQV